jgi:hypothetical protein
MNLGASLPRNLKRHNLLIGNTLRYTKSPTSKLNSLRHGWLLLPPLHKHRAKSVHARGLLHEAAAVPLSCCHTRAPIGRRSRRSTTVLRHHAVGATMPSPAPAAGPLCHRVVSCCVRLAWQGRGMCARCANRARRCCATGPRADSAHWPSICFAIF